MSFTKIIIKDFPYPPTLNSAYPTNKYGRRYTGAKLLAFKTQCDLWAKQNGNIFTQIEALKKIIQLDKFYVEIKIIFSVPSSNIWTKEFKVKKSDVDNRIKALFDSLAKLLDIDDKFFSIGLATKTYNNNGEFKTMLSIDYKTIQHESEVAKEL